MALVFVFLFCRTRVESVSNPSSCSSQIQNAHMHGTWTSTLIHTNTKPNNKKNRTYTLYGKVVFQLICDLEQLVRLASELRVFRSLVRMHGRCCMVGARVHVCVCVRARWLLLEQTSKGRSARHPNHRRRPFRTYRICVCMRFGWGPTTTTTTAADRAEINRVLYLRRVHQPVEMRAAKQDIIIKLNYRMRMA